MSVIVEKDSSLRQAVQILFGAIDGAQGERISAEFLVKRTVRGETSRTMNGVFTQSGARNDSYKRLSSRT